MENNYYVITLFATYIVYYFSTTTFSKSPIKRYMISELRTVLKLKICVSEDLETHFVTMNLVETIIVLVTAHFTGTVLAGK